MRNDRAIRSEAPANPSSEVAGRGTGARGLKSIIEDVLLNSMFEVPSRPDIKRCVITEQSIQDGVEPLLLTEEPRHVDAEGGEAAVADKTA